MSVTDLFNSQTCPWYVNLGTAAIAAAGAYSSYQKIRLGNDRLLFFGFFMLVIGANVAMLFSKTKGGE